MMALISFSTTSLRRYRAFRENYCFCFVEGRRSENGLQFFSAKSSWSNPHTLNTDVLRMPDRGTSSSRGKFSTTQAQTYDFQTQNQLPEPERKISMTASQAVAHFSCVTPSEKNYGKQTITHLSVEERVSRSFTKQQTQRFAFHKRRYRKLSLHTFPNRQA